jgi:PAS domain S-box-containing protein
VAGAARSLVTLGRLHYHLARPDRAQACLSEALALLPRLDDAPRERLAPKIRMGMGNVFWRLGEYAEALEHYLQALALYRDAGDVLGEANLLNNMGMVYGVTGEYEHALDVYRQALSIYEAHGRSSGYGLALNNIAMVYVASGEYERALEHAERSLALAREITHRSMEVNALDTTGSAYMEMGRFDEALQHFQASADLAVELGDRHNELAARINVGEALARQGRAERAQEALQQALALAQELGDTEQVRQCHSQLAQLYKQAGNYEQALAHQEAYHEADKGVYSERADMRFKTLQVRQETEKARHEAEIAHLRSVELEQEIAERREIEAALRESEAKFRLLMEESPIGVQVHAPDGTLIHVNKAWRRIWDVGREVVAADFNLLQNPAAQELRIRDLVQRLFAGESVHMPDLFVDPQQLDLPGRARWLRVNGYTVSDPEGDVKNVVLLLEDITEQRQTEEALRQAQKNESLGTLAGGVAHDFNNLLVAMMGQTSLALNRLPADDPARPHVQKAVQAAEQAAELTEQMLAYSGRGHFSIRVLNLNELIEDNVDLFRAALSRQVQLTVQAASGLPAIEADPDQIRQLIVNLVMNGAEASGSEAGRVTVETDVRDLCGDEAHYWQYTGRPLRPGTYVSLEVRDAGAGMSPETLAHIFDPFFTTKEQGRGLGLASVLGIVRGHKGGVAVRSDVGQGTSIEVLFPASSEAVPTPPDPSEEEMGEGLVLVIDDEDMVREAVEDILSMEDIGVVTAEGGAEGLDAYRQHAPHVRLVLLDLSMPEMSGEETLRRLRQIDPGVRVVLSSGYSAGEMKQRVDAEVPAGFLQKPYSITTLLEEVKKHLAG